MASNSGNFGDLNDFGDAIEHVMNEIRQKFKDASQHEGVFEALGRFIAAVDWTEPWLIGVLSFQAAMFTFAVLFRDNQFVAGTILAIGAALIYCGERLNALLAENWKSFAKQPYFDKAGIFFSAVVSVPWLLAMFVLLVHYLLKSSSMLIKLKRKELMQKARQRARQEKQEEQAQPAAKKEK